MLALHLRWLRRFFVIDERRLRVHLYLHAGLDLQAAIAFWSELTAIDRRQFTKPYRAVADPSRRRAKHVLGCPAVVYNCAATHRLVMGMIDGVLSPGEILPG
ncbi:MAG: hypothetical protein H0V33_01610 [Acidimicrobiia bacterium]|jgi:hypothetical protein|nr:hypothetical protein [Acidimicrobiia bacterium]